MDVYVIEGGDDFYANEHELTIRLYLYLSAQIHRIVDDVTPNSDSKEFQELTECISMLRNLATMRILPYVDLDDGPLAYLNSLPETEHTQELQELIDMYIKEHKPQA